ncbi:major facilitator superfamily domain-containing protein 6-like [Dendronephthya gigantea]|uniref:major facilitator superfamily domain-containing protein 6-like n=1 Tax=Dendronephthya gigantea TaxID=151771 RepID=UPI00106B25BB|nr:major facilitator superfamily domain-containing protein 6-like [Dendronephthya gigantea]
MASSYSWKVNKDLIIYKSFYFFYFGALGAINPYLPVYLRQIGLSAFAVGLLVGIRPIVQLASAPFWTVVADKFRKRKAILVMSIMAWLVMTIALVFVEPTEEICEFTAKNSSHNVFVNYTKHKTGFFKRSTDGPVQQKLKNYFDTEVTTRTKLDYRKQQKSKLGYDAKTKRGQISDGIANNEFGKKGMAVSETLLNDFEAKISSVNNTSKKPESNIISSSGDHQILDEGSTDEHKVFDPFNMNGKSKSSAGAELAKFFATAHKSGDTSTDAHYYNMNRAESQHVKSVNKTSEGSLETKQTSDKPGKNGTSKYQKIKEDKVIKLAQSYNRRVKHTNNTLTVVQTNLFKSNRNEMKRLFVILLVLIVVGEFLETPSAPLSDASLLEYLGEYRIHYGRQRLWGSLGHGIASFLVGTLLERSRHLTCNEQFVDYTSSFSVFTTFMLITLVISANFTFRYKDVEETSNGVLSTVLSIHYVSFLTAVCYMGICHGLLHNFLMWFLEDLGGSKTLMGLSIFSRNSADLIMFFIVSRLIEIFGQIKIVFISLISYGTIFIAYSTMANPWFALAVEFLGGFTFAASWTACTSYLAEAAPQESVTTMQGILQGVYWGLGLGSGSILGGHLIHTLGPQWTFRAAATGSFVVASLFAATQWKWQRHDLDDSLGIYQYFSAVEPKDAEDLLIDNMACEKKLKSTNKKSLRKLEKKRKARN